MAESGAIPDGFGTWREGGTTLVLRAGAADALRAAGVADPVAAATAAGTAARTFQGRGRPVSFPVPGAGMRVVARRYLRGGLLRGVAPGLFPGAGRFLNELRAADALFRAGAPVPEPLGLVVQEARVGVARGWFLSREAEGAEDLVALLLRLPPGDAARREALRAAGRAVRRLHDAGGLHADLHAKNLLVLPDGSVLAADLDGARVLPGGPGRDQRARQILRLDRSLVKLGFRSGRPVPATDRRRLVRAYLGTDRPGREESARWRRRQKAELARHRIGWRLGAS